MKNSWTYNMTYVCLHSIHLLTRFNKLKIAEREEGNIVSQTYSTFTFPNDFAADNKFLMNLLLICACLCFAQTNKNLQFSDKNNLPLTFFLYFSYFIIPYVIYWNHPINRVYYYTITLLLFDVHTNLQNFSMRKFFGST